MTKIVPWNGIPITSLAILFVAFLYCDPSGLDITSVSQIKKEVQRGYDLSKPRFIPRSVWLKAPDCLSIPK